MNRPGRSIHFIDGPMHRKCRDLSPIKPFVNGDFAIRMRGVAMPCQSLSQQPVEEITRLIQSFLRPVFGSVGTLSLQQAASRGPTRISLAIGKTHSRRRRWSPDKRISIQRVHSYSSVRLGEPLRGRLYSRRRGDAPGGPQALSAHSRDDPLAIMLRNQHDPSLAFQSCSSRWRWTDLTLLAGDSLGEFGDRSHDRIRNRCWFKPTSPTS